MKTFAIRYKKCGGVHAFYFVGESSVEPHWRENYAGKNFLSVPLQLVQQLTWLEAGIREENRTKPS